VLFPGLTTEIEDIQGEIDVVSHDLTLDKTTANAKLAPLKEKLAELRKKQMETRSDDKGNTRDSSRFFTFIVVSECGAIEVMAIFFAAVLAFPAAWWKKLFGIVTGIPLMYAVNIFRLSVLAVVGALDTDGKWFKFAHEYVWQAVYIVFVVAVWLAWVEYIVRRNEE
jgi:exosortase H (IPTLxxWG-CTERM-specific)